MLGPRLVLSEPAGIVLTKVPVAVAGVTVILTSTTQDDSAGITLVVFIVNWLAPGVAVTAAPAPQPLTIPGVAVFTTVPPTMLG